MLWGTKFRTLLQKNRRCDAAAKGMCTTPTHIYSICIGFRLIRTKPQDKFRIEHWKKITKISKMLWGPKFRNLSKTKRTDRHRFQREVYNFNPYIFNLYSFQIDPTKTLGTVQDRTLKKSLGLVKCCGDLSSYLKQKRKFC